MRRTLRRGVPNIVVWEVERIVAFIPSSNAWRRFPGPADFARRMDSPGIKTIRGRALDVEIR